jgi:hypothetical protein
MTPAEETHFANFSMMMIWGLNATCVAPNGTAYAADCTSQASFCTCLPDHREDQVWVAEMDDNLHVQGQRWVTKGATMCGSSIIVTRAGAD